MIPVPRPRQVVTPAQAAALDALCPPARRKPALHALRPSMSRGGLGLSRRPVAAGGSLLLDTYGADLVCGYSMARRLKTGVTNCMRIQVNGAGGTTDIGFDGSGNLDTATILSTITSGDGHIERLYDQGGNGIYLGQGTGANQPKIATAGAINTIGGIPCALFDGTNDALSSSGSAPTFGTTWGLSGDVVFTAVIVHRKTTNTKGHTFGWGDTTAAREAVGHYDDGTNGLIAYAGGNSKPITVPTNNTHYITVVAKAATGQISATTCTRNGSSVTSGTGSTNTPNVDGGFPLKLGQWANGGSEFFGGGIQEFLLWDADKSADIAAILAAINSYYSVY